MPTLNETNLTVKQHRSLPFSFESVNTQHSQTHADHVQRRTPDCVSCTHLFPWLSLCSASFEMQCPQTSRTGGFCSVACCFRIGQANTLWKRNSRSTSTSICRPQEKRSGGEGQGNGEGKRLEETARGNDQGEMARGEMVKEKRSMMPTRNRQWKNEMQHGLQSSK